MKLLIIAPRFHTNLYHQALAFQSAGDEVKVAVLYKGKSEYYEHIDTQLLDLSLCTKILSGMIHLFRMSYLKSDFELRLQTPGSEFKQLIRSYNPDAILLKAYQNRLAMKILRLAKKKNIKVLLHTQTNMTEIFGSKYLFKINMKLFRRLNVLAYITPILSNYQKFKAFGIDNVHYLPFVFPITDHTTLRFINEKELVKILMIGKYTKRKDQLILIEACEELHQKGFNIELNIFGELADPSYFEELKQHVANHKSDSYILLNKNIPYTDILNEYSKNHVFVLPSYNEPAAFSIVEAMAMALPVICSDDCGTKCYIENTVNGYIFKAKDKNDLIEKITNTISNPEKYENLSKNALALVLKNHNPNDFANSIKKLMN